MKIERMRGGLQDDPGEAEVITNPTVPQTRCEP